MKLIITIILVLVLIANVLSTNVISNNNCSLNTTYGIYATIEIYGNIIGNQCVGSNYGIYLFDGIANCNVSSNRCDANGVDGIKLLKDSSNNIINNNTCKENDEAGIRIELRCNNNSISENICIENGHGGISLWASSLNTISGNICNNNSQSSVGTYDGIFLGTAISIYSTYNILNGNQCNDTQGVSATQGVGIWESDGNQNYNTITDNICTGNITTPIRSLGLNDIVFNNAEA